MRPLVVDPDADEFRQLASEWHGGQWSPLYAYASSGSVVPGLCQEIRGNLRFLAGSGWPDRLEQERLLSAFLGHVSPIEDSLMQEEG